MKIIRCKNEHYYDSEKYEQCPYCMEEQCEKNGLKNSMFIGEEDRTLSFHNQENEDDFTIHMSVDETEDVTISYTEETPFMQEKTISLYHKAGQVDKVSGWLVCIEGETRGASYPLGMGRNFIGRAPDMDICLAEDRMVSRRNHAEIVFDVQNNIFYAVPGCGVLKLEGTLLRKPAELKEDMILEIGDSRFCFIPYCNGRRKWE